MLRRSGRDSVPSALLSHTPSLPARSLVYSSFLSSGEIAGRSFLLWLSRISTVLPPAAFQIGAVTWNCVKLISFPFELREGNVGVEDPSVKACGVPAASGNRQSFLVPPSRLDATMSALPSALQSTP